MEIIIKAVINDYLDSTPFHLPQCDRKYLLYKTKQVSSMWLNEMVTQNMFVEKVKNQKVELETARKRHTELLKKCQHLEQEQNKLNDLVKSNQIDIITKKNNLNALLADLMNQKKLNLTATQRLEICKEQINMIQDNIEQTNDVTIDPITELAPIKEKLSFKWDVVECLQEKLFATRLQAAEKEAIITELKQREKDLKNEIELLKNSKNDTIPFNQLQEEFLTARIHEADVILEFDKLKRSLAIIKQELEEKKLETELESFRDNDDSSFHIHLNLRDRYHDQLKLQEEASIAITVKLQNEIDHLKMQIKKLEEMKQDITGRVYFNEEVKVHLHEVKTSIFLRLQRTNQELEKVITKNTKLEEKLFRNLAEIQSSIDDKDTIISQLAQDIRKLQLLNEKCMKSNDESMASLNEDTVNKLQQETEFLQEKIMLLSKSLKPS